MNVYVVYAHPSKWSFTWEVLQAFTRGLRDAGHTVEVGDLYAMDFQTDMDLEQYERETGPDPDAPVPEDVRREQEKIAQADAVAFVYPVWWTDCPAKLKGWFDRVLTHGYSYLRGGWKERDKPIKIKSVVVLCPAGQTEERLERSGLAQSMRKIMLEDRVPGLGAQASQMVILGGMTNDEDGANRERNLERAREVGLILDQMEPATATVAGCCCG
jgi:NAD(P)H dehydrogenase (quinone)